MKRNEKKFKRSKEISLMARDFWIANEEKLNEISKKLDTSMEINHFLTNFTNHAAIQLCLLDGAKEGKNQ